MSMRLLGSLVLLSLMVATCRVKADQPDARLTGLLTQLRELEKQIEQVRGLKFKKPVVAQVIPRPERGYQGVQGYYDSKKKALFIFDDIKGNYQKGTLIHEMVHALQDQHFGLGRRDDIVSGTDAEMALAALIEGDATYTMIEVLRKEQPHVEKMLETTLDKARNLRNAFLYGIGARYVQTLKKRGGWEAVNLRYRFTPTSTAAILHPEQRITAVNLGPGKRVGEFGLIQLLASQPATRSRAVEAANGWRGDRLVEDKGGTLWVVAFASPEQARRFQNTLTDLIQAEYPKLQRVDAADGSRWTSEAGTVRTVQLRGTRVVEIQAGSEAAYRDLLDRLDGPVRFEVYSARDKRLISPGALTDALLEADMVCIGESHDSELHHRVQLQLIKELFARDERLGVGMEMFQRPFQKALDRYLSGVTDEATLLEDSEYAKRWGYDWMLYRPIVDFCKRNRIPVAALNVSDELRGKVSKVGYEKLSDEDKKLLGSIDFQVKEHRSYWFDRLGDLHGNNKASPEAKERSYQVMTIWDEYMADSAVRFQKERQLRRMVVLAGSGHIDRGFGIPQRAAKRSGGRVMTVRVLLGGEVEAIAKDPQADFVVIVR